MPVSKCDAAGQKLKPGDKAIMMVSKDKSYLVTVLEIYPVNYYKQTIKLPETSEGTLLLLENHSHLNVTELKI